MADVYVWLVAHGDYTSWGNHSSSSVQIFTEEDVARQAFAAAVEKSRVQGPGRYDEGTTPGGQDPEGRFASLHRIADGGFLRGSFGWPDEGDWDPGSAETVESWNWSDDPGALEAARIVWAGQRRES